MLLNLNKTGIGIYNQMRLILINLVFDFTIRCFFSLFNWYRNFASDASYPYKTGIGIYNEVPLRLACTVTSLTSFRRKNLYFSSKKNKSTTVLFV